MRVAFRVDSSNEIGSGHLMRCKTLADALHKDGVECIFISRPLPGNLIPFLETQYKVISLSATGLNRDGTLKDKFSYKSWLGVDFFDDVAETHEVLSSLNIDWLVVDHYALDSRWECLIKPKIRFLMVIDDLADRTHDCDLLLDQNLNRKTEDYLGLVPSDAALLTGPEFSLLRPEFSKYRAFSLSRRAKPEFQKLVISFGGIDRDNLTGKVLKALNECDLSANILITVVLGMGAPWHKEVEDLAARMKFKTKVYTYVQDMAGLMAESDLAIGAAGGTAWERCCLGLPSIILVTAENQRSGAIALNEIGAAFLIDDLNCLKEIFNDKFLSGPIFLFLKKMSKVASKITDGNGAHKVVKKIFANYE